MRSGRVGIAGEGDDVLLVPDLPFADRQEGEIGVFVPEGAFGAIATDRLAQEVAQAQRCQALLTGMSIASGATQPGRAAEEGEDPDPVLGGELDRAIESVPVRGATEEFSGWIEDQYIGSRTLVIAACCINSKSESVRPPCGEMPTKPGGDAPGGRPGGQREKGQRDQDQLRTMCHWEPPAGK